MMEVRSGNLNTIVFALKNAATAEESFCRPPLLLLLLRVTAVYDMLVLLVDEMPTQESDILGPDE